LPGLYPPLAELGYLTALFFIVANNKVL